METQSRQKIFTLKDSSVLEDEFQLEQDNSKTVWDKQDLVPKSPNEKGTSLSNSKTVGTEFFRRKKRRRMTKAVSNISSDRDFMQKKYEQRQKSSVQLPETLEKFDVPIKKRKIDSNEEAQILYTDNFLSSLKIKPRKVKPRKQQTEQILHDEIEKQWEDTQYSDEILIGKGVGNWLKFLRNTNLLGQEKYFSKGHLVVEGGIDRRDFQGRRIDSKQAFRQQWYSFHGQKQSVAKRTRLEKREQAEAKALKSSGGLLAAQKAIMRKKKQSHIVIKP